MDAKDPSGIEIVKKNEISKLFWGADHNFSWDQKKVADKESRLIPRKIKETVHSLKNLNHINRISNILPEIRLPNLYVCISRCYRVWYLSHPSQNVRHYKVS